MLCQTAVPFANFQNGRKWSFVRCKVPKGGSSGGTGIPLQPMGVEPGIAKTIYVE